MSSPVRVVEYNTSVADAYNMMMRMGIRRLPVVDEERLVGIVGWEISRSQALVILPASVSTSSTT